MEMNERQVPQVGDVWNVDHAGKAKTGTITSVTTRTVCTACNAHVRWLGDDGKENGWCMSAFLTHCTLVSRPSSTPAPVKGTGGWRALCTACAIATGLGNVGAKLLPDGRYWERGTCCECARTVDVGLFAATPPAPAPSPPPQVKATPVRGRESYEEMLAKLEAEEGVAPKPTCCACEARGPVSDDGKCAECCALDDVGTAHAMAMRAEALGRGAPVEAPPWRPSCPDDFDLPDVGEFGSAL